MTRRTFLDAMAAIPAAATLSREWRAAQPAPTGPAGVGMPADLARSTAPSAADLGSNFDTVRRLDAGTGYPGSFLSGRFPSVDAFTAAVRASILEAYGYRPAQVPPAAEVVDR